MKANQKLIDFISKIEGKLLKDSSETIILSNQLENSIFGGKNRGCSNADDGCNKSKNRNCTNYNKKGCTDSTNKGTCSNTKPV